MNQSRTLSAIEATTSTAIGFLVSWTLTVTVLPAFGYDVTFGHSVGITTVFTVASVVRAYIVRRWFDGKVARLGKENGNG